MFLDNELKKLKTFLPNAQLQNAMVSEREIGWHIDHSLKVIITISRALQTSDPLEYRWKFNALRFLVYTWGRIPRGKGKAPKAVQSFDTITADVLSLQFNEANTIAKTLYLLPPRSYFIHPYFGMLNLKQSQRFLKIHTKHHIKIIEDIQDIL